MVDATVVSQKNVLFDSDSIATRDAHTAPSAMADPAAVPATYVADEFQPETITDGGPESGEEYPESAEATMRDVDPGRLDQPALSTTSDAAMNQESHASDGHTSDTTATAALKDEFSEPLSVEAEAEAFEASFQRATSGPQEPMIRDRDMTGASDTDPATIATDTTNVVAAPAVSLADNLLLNKAKITTTGVDEFIEMREAFAAAAEKLAVGAETIAQDVAQDALFAGKEALRVLQVDGNLAKINIFEQTNIVGDADQIRLEMHALRDRLEAEMKLIAGSNALVNLATATEYGVDSKIMAAGHVYEDAFIHQAELIDNNATPSGVAVSALANEAIAAFLSEDMLTSAADIDAIVPTGHVDAASHLDVMQTALT
jgi:hypothetical protein